MTRPCPASPGDLWAITSYFNPIGYRRRRDNYTLFRHALNVPLLTVELAYGRDFELRAGDATLLVQLRSDQVLWQKERLLDLAIRRLPAECRTVVWLDCDVLFASDDWAQRTRRALASAVLVQPFTRVYDLRRDATELSPGKSFLVRESMASKYAAGTMDLNTTSVNMLSQHSPGHAWAMRREVLEDVGLYDAMIVGSADYAIASAAIGDSDRIVRAYEMNERQAAHFREWAQRFHHVVGGRLRASPGDLYHLWHGELEDRHYDDRYSALTRFGFDPFSDIAVDASGCWRWSSDKPDLREYVRAYFEARKEDGPEHGAKSVGRNGAAPR